MSPTARHLVTLIAGCFLSLTLLGASADAAPSGPPVRIGGTLGLTGPLAPTAIIPKIVGEIAAEQLNRKNGLLGRPVEYVLLDDQSKPDVARTLYERLVTQDKVDLLIGDPTKATQQLGWKPTVSFKELVRLMVAEDLRLEGLDPSKIMKSKEKSRERDDNEKLLE